MEVAAGLAGAGLSTTMVFPDPHLLSRLFTAKIAGFYETVFEGGCDSGLETACQRPPPPPASLPAGRTCWPDPSPQRHTGPHWRLLIHGPSLPSHLFLVPSYSPV